MLSKLECFEYFIFDFFGKKAKQVVMKHPVLLHKITKTGDSYPEIA